MIWNAGQQRVHMLKILILIEVKQLLEAGLHELRVLADEDMFTF